MHYRRRVLLSILAGNGSCMEKIRLQKLLFLFAQQQKEPSYYFLPYRYGCYSFQAGQDAKILADHYGMLEINKKDYRLCRDKVKEEYLELKSEDRRQLENLFQQYGKLSKNKLTYQVYKQYPWYAVNSEILNEPYFKELRGLAAGERPRINGNVPVLYTIGYEGESIERYITRLMKNCVSMLVDVRYNPFSMKYGFSKSQLQHVAEQCKIKYIHVRDLGIEGSHRKHLSSRADYDRLFTQYRNSLPRKEEGLRLIQAMLNKHLRVAMTCFEKDYKACHRNVLAETIHARRGVNIQHL